MEQIKAVLDRNAKALELRPSIGQGTAVTKVRLTGDWRARSKRVGGS